MHMKKYPLLLLALTAASYGASAGELGYNSVEFGYQQAKSSTHYRTDYSSKQDMRPKGYYLQGSVELGSSPLYIFGGMASGKDGVTEHINGVRYRDSYHKRDYNLGLGFHHDLAKRLDLIGSVSYLRQANRLTYRESGLHEYNYNSNGMGMSVGVNGLMTDHLQGWATVDYTKWKRESGSFGTTLGMQYKFNKTWGVTSQVGFAKHYSDFGVGVRASF